MESNVCKFIKTEKDVGINILNFVYEKEALFKQQYVISSAYSLGLVTNGEGKLHTHFGDFGLSKGDLFLTFPAKAYYIENTNGLQYIYITFSGLRVQMLLERLEVSFNAPVYRDFGFLEETWEKYFNIINNNNADLFCEALILYTFGFMCQSITEKSYTEKANGILLIKQYVDENFTDCSINLKALGERFNYNPKYLSSAFKKMVRVSFSEYLKMKRFEHAITLIEGGINNINDLSELCGYGDASSFAKSFKKQYGVTPKQWKKRQQHE